MSEVSPRSKAATEIRVAVDDIATQLMVKDTPTPADVRSWTDTLSLLSMVATEAQLNDVSLLTESLITNLNAGTGAPAMDGIIKLQEAVERAEQSLQQDLAPAKGIVEAAPESAALSADPELVSEFVMESRDHLSSIEERLLALEQDASNTDTVHSIFRSFHTVKGLAGFLDFPLIRNVAHEVETLLDMARNAQLTVTGPVVDVILESADFLKAEIDLVEAHLQGKPDGVSADSSSLLARVKLLMKGDTTAAELVPQKASTAADDHRIVTQSKQVDNAAVNDRVAGSAGDPPGPSSSQKPVAPTSTPPAHAQELPTPAESSDPAKIAEKRTPAASASEASRFIKVDTAKLDFLVDMVGELVISQSILKHDEHLSSAITQKLQRNLSQLSRITADVQKTAMSMRMVPVGQLFQRSVRLVRDLTKKSGKKVDLELAGEDTELDRTLVEDLADPLMHMIRNAADHGVEPPEERISNGKNPLGHISLKAFHQAGNIVIELADDGRGLNRDRILKKARERGLVSGDGSQMTDSDVYNLIFEPGFSTAEKITDISGRGVGMDVVRRQVQKMRGRIEISSAIGKGTTFSIKLPLTLAIIDGLVVTVGAERYVVPIYAVREMFRPSSDKLFTVEGKAEMVLVRGSLLPVIRLHQLFGVTPKSVDPVSSLVVVAESGNFRFCLLVDDMLGKQEVVIKNLGESFKNVRGVAGGAILGDGRVGLILDIDAVFGDRAHAAAHN